LVQLVFPVHSAQPDPAVDVTDQWFMYCACGVLHALPALGCASGSHERGVLHDCQVHGHCVTSACTFLNLCRPLCHAWCCHRVNGFVPCSLRLLRRPLLVELLRSAASLKATLHMPLSSLAGCTLWSCTVCYLPMLGDMTCRSGFDCTCGLRMCCMLGLHSALHCCALMCALLLLTYFL
jgi:hypothetical protein